MKTTQTREIRHRDRRFETSIVQRGDGTFLATVVTGSTTTEQPCNSEWYAHRWIDMFIAAVCGFQTAAEPAPAMVDHGD